MIILRFRGRAAPPTGIAVTGDAGAPAGAAAFAAAASVMPIAPTPAVCKKSRRLLFINILSR
jgi:hypothetical protein